MFRSPSRCRTGMFIVAGSLLATGLFARETRELRAPVRADRVIAAPVLEAEQLPSVEAQVEMLYNRVKAMADTPQGVIEPFQAFREALQQGHVDDAAIWACLANVSDVQVQVKLEGVMRDFADRVLAGEPGIPVTEMPLEARPPSLRAIQVPELPSRIGSKALCNTCTTASGIATPTTSCQYVSGNTTTACPSDFYQTTLTAGTTYQFTFCSADCPSASAAGSWDTRLIIRNTACAILVNVDDSCGLQSRAQITPSTTGTYIIEVTGFTASNVGSYTLGYRALAASTCGSCASPSATITPTTTCQFISGSNTTCPTSSGTSISSSGGVWYNVNLIGGRQYTFSTCPNNGAGGTCFGTGSYDTRIDLWNSACTTWLTGNDDVTCSLIFRSAFLYTAPSSGVYKLQVRGFSNGDMGTYTLAYQERAGCTPPGVTSAGPTTGTTSSTSCSVNQTFSVGLSPLTTTPVTGTFTISAPAGSSASPSSGTISYSGTNGSFSSLLTKAACGIANFTVTVTASNSCGSTSSTFIYQLRDATAPVVTGCPPGMTLDCAAPDPPAPTRVATDNCDPAPTVTFSEARIAGTCPGNYTTQRTWTARDCNNNVGVCTQSILHRDTTPPSIVGADTFCLYPPNHEYYCFQSSSLTPSLTDDCSTPVSLVIVGCTSNEPDEGTGDGDFPNDCVVSPDGKEVCLRSERAGSENDRVYAVMGIAIDACGNRSAPQAVALVTVPHDDSEHPECRQPNSGLDKRF